MTIVRDDLRPAFQDTLYAPPLITPADGSYTAAFPDRALAFRANADGTRDFVQGDGLTGFDALPAAGGLSSFTQSGTGAVKRPALDKLRSIGISPHDYGANGGGFGDDSAAVQKAIDRAQATGAPIRIDDTFKAKGLKINRPIDGSFDRLLFQGAGGSRPGFLIEGDGALFDTDLAFDGTYPNVGEVDFDMINFTAPDATANSVTLAGGKFANIGLSRCNWSKLRLLNYETFAQGIHMDHCRAMSWGAASHFFRSKGCYDVDVFDLRTKFGGINGGGVFRWEGGGAGGGKNFPELRASVSGSCFEGCGTILTAGGMNAVTFDSNYCEFNWAPALDFTLGGNANTIVMGNTFSPSVGQNADPNFWDAKLGSTLRCFSSGNFSTGRLYDTIAMVGSCLLSIESDIVVGEAFRGFKAGPQSAAFAGVGNVDYRDTDLGLVHFRGSSWSCDRSALPGVGANLPGRAFGPGVLIGGALVPVREVRGPVNPVSDSTPYGGGGIAWAAGSYVRNSAPAAGAPKGWVCLASGVPGTWVADSNW